MGHDPYWPTSLAAINAVCTPVTPVSAARFDEIYRALGRASQVDLADLGDAIRLSSDLINTADFRKGSAVFNFSNDSPHHNIERFSLEPNASPQVVLGIYDAAQPGVDHVSVDLPRLTARLKSSFTADHSTPVCVILAIGDLSSTDGAVIPVRNIDDEHVYNAMKAVYIKFAADLSQMGQRLVDHTFANPKFRRASTPVRQQFSGQGAEDHPAAPAEVQDSDKQLLRGRYTFAIGLLNLYAGSWLDTMRRLNEAAAIARQNEDYLWQARALETMLICMLLLASRNIDFTVPDICVQAYNTSQMMSKSSFLGKPTTANLSYHSKPDADLSPIQKWSKYTAVVAQAVLNVYTDLSVTAGTSLPAPILTESRIRVLNLLAFVSDEANISSAGNFELFVLHRQHPAQSATSSALRTSAAVGSGIPSLLLAALPKISEESVGPDEFAATIAIVSCLSALGSLRRHALILRDLLPRLAQTLTKARKLGASEAGLHPESALSSQVQLSKSSTSKLAGSLRPLLDATTAAYGLTSPNDVMGLGTLISSERIAANLNSWCEHHVDGDLNLKTEVLVQCIEICDAVPDPVGRLRVTSMLLRLAVESITISNTATNLPPSLSVNRQGRLVEGIRRVSDAAQQLGLKDARASYWDDFLVRDIQVFQDPNAAVLNSHAPSELSLVERQAGSGGRDPFIFNPFARNTTIQAAPVVVAGELVTFAVLLQNPLEVEVDVHAIELATEGCDFQPSSHSVVLGPLCSQIFKLTGKALTAGTLELLGCKVTVAGCHTETFPILSSDWHLPIKIKQKSVTSRRRAGVSAFTESELNVPEARTLSLTVIEPQPILEVASSTLPETSLMLLEGEQRQFSLHLKNVSATVPTDFLLLSSNDNVSKDLRGTLSRKDIQPIDTYEVQHQLKHRPVVQIPSAQFSNPIRIGPQETASYTVEVWGRPGLTDASVHIDFANLKKPRSEIHQTFYTRQVRFPLALTVNGSIDIVRCNILPIQGDLPQTSLFSYRTSGNGLLEEGHRAEVSKPSGEAPSANDLCMLSLDLRNVWPQPLSVELVSRMQQASSSLQGSSRDDSSHYTVSELIQPGHINRVILLIPRLLVETPLAPIPNLDAKKQFVVNASKLGIDAEAATRENFWYREALLRHISGSWEEPKTGRRGEIDLRKGIRLNLNARMIDVLRVEHVEVSYTLGEQAVPKGEASAVTELESNHYSLYTESFATLRVRVRNLSKDKLPLMLRLQPSLRGQPHNIALDLSRRLAWSGVLQRVLHPPLEPGDERVAELGLVAYAAGQYDINATVEETRPRVKPASDTSDLDFHGRRRLWHAHAPCLIDAIDPAPASPA